MFKELADYFEKSHAEWENLCLRCGACCGSFDDPCTHLQKDKQGKYYCDIYDYRFGPRVSISGDKFDCVPIWEIFRSHWKNDHLCAYKRHRKMPWLKSKLKQQKELCK